MHEVQFMCRQAQFMKQKVSIHANGNSLNKKNTYDCKCFFCSGDDLLSQAASHQVSSALQSLTSVFGMGTGVTSVSLSPNIHVYLESLILSKLNNANFDFNNSLYQRNLPLFSDQALGLLVSLSSIHYCTYTCDLSTM